MLLTVNFGWRSLIGWIIVGWLLSNVWRLVTRVFRTEVADLTIRLLALVAVYPLGALILLRLTSP